MRQPSSDIIPIALRLANVFLVRGERWIIVDSGAPGDGAAILHAANRHGITARDIGLILLTHGHVDHFGAADELRRLTGAPIAVHVADLPFLESGRNPDSLQSVGWEGRMLRPFLPWTATPFSPDVAFTGDFDLEPYGLAARTIHTPGHSPGHIALPLPGGNIIAGDLLRGGIFGGRLQPRQPYPPYYVDDHAQLTASLTRILTPDITTLYVGHGGPLTAERVRARLNQLTA